MIATPKAPVTRTGAFNFFFGGSIVYGAGFGTLYGTGVSLIFAFIDPVYVVTIALTIGLTIGLALGIMDGLIIGNYASRLARQGIPAANIGKAIRLRTPIATAANGAFLIMALHIYSNSAEAFDPSSTIVWLIAIFASWHAAVIVTRKFAKEFE